MRPWPWKKIIGWSAFTLLLLGIVWFGYRVWYYVDMIRSGAMIDLPQYAAKTSSVSATGPLRLSNDHVDRAAVEDLARPALGTASPRLTIVEFADFQCPYSKEAASTVRSLMATYGDRVRLIYRHFPISEIHPDAEQAAQAAECANEQGKFWLYHDKLYGAATLSYAALVTAAEEVGLDTKQFGDCLGSGKYKNVVESDAALAKQIGLRGTPTFIFDGQVIEGSIPRDVFQRILDRMLQ